jgi:tetratricopeptide (TPR) repeat protein
LVDKLHDLAPYDENIAWYIWKTKYHQKPTYEEALALYQPVLAYDDEAMEKVAAPLQDQPAKYVELMSRAAAVNPSDYFTLADYYTARQEDDQAAASIEKGNAHDPDSVRAAEYASWLVKYYLKQGRVADARREADFGGDVYSAPGLLAKAEFLEATGDYPGAYQWFANDEERYDDPAPLIAFCLRYKAKTGDSRYDGEVRQRLGKLFPQGIEKVGLGDFQSAPTDGVLIVEENDVMRRFNLHQDNVIVAVSGVRIHNDKQYNYARNLSSDPAMDLIVWQGNQYHEIKASPPGHRFGGGEFGDYVAK